jgi:hypothetical protein
VGSQQANNSSINTSVTANSRQIIKDCRRWLCQAVVVIFTDENSDWHYFRIERVFGDKIAFTGMTDAEGNKHDGDFFWAKASEIESVKLRE